MTVHNIGNRVVAPHRQTSTDQRTVREVQHTLDHLDPSNALPENGRFDERTVAAVTAFQDRAHVQTSARGKIDQATVDALNRAEADAFLGPQRAPVNLGGADASTFAPAVQAAIAQPAGVDPQRLSQFQQFVAANDAAESGGQSVASTRPTTAGAPASFGAGQLLTSNHLDQLGRQPAEVQAALGLDPVAIANLAGRGRSAQGWYNGVARGRPIAGLSATDNQKLQALLSSGQSPEVVRRFGPAFSQATGLQSTDLQAMLDGRALHDPALQTEYRQLTAGQHLRPGAAVDQLVTRHPELGSLRDRLGRDGLVEAFSKPGRGGEDGAGWFTRGAMTDPSYGRFTNAIAHGADALDTRSFEAAEFNRSVRFVEQNIAGFDALPDREQALLLGQLTRAQHLSPGGLNAVARQNPRTVDELRDAIAHIDTAGSRPGAQPATSYGTAIARFTRFFDEQNPTGE